jgi:TolB protein
LDKLNLISEMQTTANQPISLNTPLDKAAGQRGHPADQSTTDGNTFSLSPGVRAGMTRFVSRNLIFIAACVVALSSARVTRAGEPEELSIPKEMTTFGQKPVPVSLEGFTGEGAQVLKFDLYVQGFTFVGPDTAQYIIKGSDAGNITGSLADKFAKNTLFSKSYNGASLRRQAHAFADDVVAAIRNTKPIGGSKIAYKSQSTAGAGEIFVSDFDGFGAQPATSDGAIVARPAWLPGRLALYYTSYVRGNPDIFFHSLSSGQRRVFAGYSGLNTSAAASPDGSKVAMVLSKMGSPNVWVCNADGSDLRRLTKGIEDSSPCWSPDGQTICFAAKINARRVLAKVSAGGGEVQRLSTAGASNPTEPDWSPDGKWIAFTSQAGDFSVCVVSADGKVGPVTLVAGQNPSWSANSRTLVYNRGPAGHQRLAVLDVFTKQTRDCHAASGSNSEPAWSR